MELLERRRCGLVLLGWLRGTKEVGGGCLIVRFLVMRYGGVNYGDIACFTTRDMG